tara:strand:- start:13308 stop:13904 length:597 start_codon:yes stop_codon:yes gene_type:complete
MAHYAYISNKKHIQGHLKELEEVKQKQNDLTYENVEEDQQKLNELIEEEKAIQEKINLSLCDVVKVITGVDEIDENGEDKTEYWEKYYNHGYPEWKVKRMSYNTIQGTHTQGNTPFRKNYVGVGGIYDPVRDAFYEKQRNSCWLLDEEKCIWVPPSSWVQDEKENWMPPVEKPHSEDGSLYEWDEDNVTWKKIENGNN